MFFFKERINIFFYVVFEGIGARALLAVEVLVEEENFIEHHLRGPMLAMKMGGHFSIQKESMVSSGYFPLTAQASIRPYLDTQLLKVKTCFKHSIQRSQKDKELHICLAKIGAASVVNLRPLLEKKENAITQKKKKINKIKKKNTWIFKGDNIAISCQPEARDTILLLFKKKMILG